MKKRMYTQIVGRIYRTVVMSFLSKEEEKYNHYIIRGKRKKIKGTLDEKSFDEIYSVNQVEF